MARPGGHEPSEHAIIKKAQNTPSASHSGSICIKPTLLNAHKIKAVLSNENVSATTAFPTGNPT